MSELYAYGVGAVRLRRKVNAITMNAVETGDLQ
jgi:hypothetical protein